MNERIGDIVGGNGQAQWEQVYADTVCSTLLAEAIPTTQNDP